MPGYVPTDPGNVRLNDVLTVLDALERAGVRYAVFGGLAMAAHGFGSDEDL